MLNRVGSLIQVALMRRASLANGLAVTAGYRFATSAPPTNPFEVVFSVSTNDEFLLGAKQAYCALGSCLRNAAMGTELPPVGFATNRFLESVVSARKRSYNLARIAGADEHVAESSIGFISITLREKELPVDDLTASIPKWSMTFAERTPPDQWTDEVDEQTAGASRSGEMTKAAEEIPELSPVLRNTPLSPAERAAKVSELARKYHVRCATDMVIASPPERWVNVEAFHHYLSSIDAPDIKLRKHAARVLTTANVYPFFNFIDRLHRRMTGSQFLIQLQDSRYGLSDAKVVPHMVKKTVIFELTPDLRWEVDQVQIDSSQYPVQSPEFAKP